MIPARSIASLLDDFAQTLSARQGDHLSVADVLEALHERGFGLVLLFLALPMALPLPVPPVLNVMLALPLLFLTAQQMAGRHRLWLPRAILHRKIEAKALYETLLKIIPPLQKMEALTKPRLIVITGSVAQKMTGFLGLVMALSVMVPLPLTNTVPSLGIALMSLGVLTRDGLAIIFGALIGIGWVVMLSFALIYFGAEGIDIVKDFIKSIL